MAIEIVDFPMKNGDFPVRYVKLPEGKPQKNDLRMMGSNGKPTVNIDFDIGEMSGGGCPKSTWIFMVKKIVAHGFWALQISVECGWSSMALEISRNQKRWSVLEAQIGMVLSQFSSSTTLYQSNPAKTQIPQENILGMNMLWLPRFPGFQMLSLLKTWSFTDAEFGLYHEFFLNPSMIPWLMIVTRPKQIDTPFIS